MSLVDYASSSDEDEPQAPAKEENFEQGREIPDKLQRFEVPAAGSSSAVPPNNGPPLHAHNRNSAPSPMIQMEIVSNQSQSAELKLPDASLLLNSPAVSSNILNSSDHSSRVAAAMAQNTEQKRELNRSPADNPRSKVPKGTLPYLKNVPDTGGGRLLPPQLVGRSNIVTEDISKLFVRQRNNSSTE